MFGQIRNTNCPQDSLSPLTDRDRLVAEHGNTSPTMSDKKTAAKETFSKFLLRKVYQLAAVRYSLRNNVQLDRTRQKPFLRCGRGDRIKAEHLASRD